MLFAVGLGLVLHFGHVWYRLPHYSAAEIDQSVVVNLAIEQRASSVIAGEARLKQRQEEIRNELHVEIAKERREPLRYVLLGTFLLLLSSFHLWLLRRGAAR